MGFGGQTQFISFLLVLQVLFRLSSLPTPWAQLFLLPTFVPLVDCLVRQDRLGLSP